MLRNDQCLIYVNTWSSHTLYNRVITILSNGAPHGLFCDIGHHTKAINKCAIWWCVKIGKYYPKRGIYTNMAKKGIASLYCQCYNSISYSGHPSGSVIYRFAKIWGGTWAISSPWPNILHVKLTCHLCGNYTCCIKSKLRAFASSGLDEVNLGQMICRVSPQIGVIQLEIRTECSP